VPIDRDLVLKQAETFLRQGELDGAVAEYLRLVETEDLEGAYRGVDAVTDVALLEGDVNRAIAALQTFLIRVTHVPALVKLVTICVEADRREPLREAQAILADAYLDTGRASEARPLIEALLADDPQSQAHLQRLHRVLQMLGVNSVESDPADDSRFTVDVDVSDILPVIEAAAPEPPRDEPPPDLDTVFAQMRTRVAEQPETASAASVYERGLDHLLHGRIREAVDDLRTAARAPLYRFTAAAQLARLYIERGELKPAVEWLERAAEAPAPTPGDGSSLLYDLADTLDRLGEPGRALAVLIELDADAPGYRDVRQRIEQLSRDRQGGSSA
jgi:tetratricopeptide (TPR) repeat protein